MTLERRGASLADRYRLERAAKGRRGAARRDPDHGGESTPGHRWLALQPRSRRLRNVCPPEES